MMPQKIEIMENIDTGYDITILGVGEMGKKAVKSYPRPKYNENHWPIHTLTFCDDDVFHHKANPKIITSRDSKEYLSQCRLKILEIINNTEILVIVGDIKNKKAFESALKFAKNHRHGSREYKKRILVNCSQESIYAEFELKKAFDLIICRGHLQYCC